MDNFFSKNIFYIYNGITIIFSFKKPTTVSQSCYDYWICPRTFRVHVDCLSNVQYYWCTRICFHLFIDCILDYPFSPWRFNVYASPVYVNCFDYFHNFLHYSANEKYLLKLPSQRGEKELISVSLPRVSLVSLVSLMGSAFRSAFCERQFKKN